MSGGSNLQGDLPPPPVRGDLALFLDFDGTLVELMPRPDDVRLDDRARSVLTAAATAMPGRVAVVSGRSLDTLDTLLGDALGAQLAMAGSHGAEHRRPGDRAVAAATPPALTIVAAELAAFADRHALVFERKSHGAALHYRQAPEREAAARACAEELAARHGLTVQLGKMMAEVRVAGTKGDAVAALMASPAMRGAVPVMIGDDVTDEAGFVAAAAAGGAGVLVGEPRPTAAAYRLAGVAAVLDWVAAVAALAKDAQ